MLNLDFDVSLLEISRRFGGICTTSAIDNRFRRIRVDAKMINEKLEAGVDPMTLKIGDSIGSAMGDGKAVGV